MDEWTDIVTLDNRPSAEHKIVRGTVVDVDVMISSVQVTVPWEGMRHTMTVTAPQSDAILTEIQHIVKHGGDSVRVDCCIAPQSRAIEKFILAAHVSSVDRRMREGSLEVEASLTTLLCSLWDRVCAPAAPNGVPCWHSDVPECRRWNSAFSLFSHQEQSLAWMLLREDPVKRRFSYSRCISVTPTWAVDVERELWTRNASETVACSKGGMCCDGAGSGKTAVALRFACTPPLRSMDSPEAIRGIETNETGATLIVVPINLVSQWRSEIEKFLTPDCRVLWFVQGKDVRAHTFEDVRTSDVVITTFQFLRSSKPYNDMLDEELGCGSMRRRANFTAWARRPARTRPILEAFCWRSVIVDEMHMTFRSTRDLARLKLFSCTTLWGLSATPDVRGDHAKKLAVFIESDAAPPFAHTHVQVPASTLHPNLLTALVSHCLWGTPSSVSRPKPVLHRITLDEPDKEDLRRRISKMKSLEDVVKVCTHIDAPHNVSVDDSEGVVNRMTMRFEASESRMSKALAWQERTVSILRRSVGELEQQVSEMDRVHDTEDALMSARVQDALHSLSIQRLHLHDGESALVQLRTQLTHAKAVKSLVRERIHLIRKQEVCSICMDNPCNIITPCAHVFCTACIHKHVHTMSETCPSCREKITPVDLISVLDGGAVAKMRTIGALLKALHSESVVLFVQWKSMVKGMRAYLKTMDISTYVLEGNYMQRAGRLNLFMQGGVLLLCMEDSFEGLHLTHANHVIFAHAIVGDRHTVEDLETQAVARSLRHGQTKEVYVYSFVVADCEEECLWNRTHSG